MAEKPRQWLKQLGVNDVRFGAWVRTGPGGHQSWSYAYNLEWERFFNRYQTPSAGQIESFFNSIRSDVRWGGGF